jgi:protein tyrosine phosphatase
MTTNLIEHNQDKCYSYWPKGEGRKVVYGHLEIKTVSEAEGEDFTTTEMEILNLKVRKPKSNFNQS